MFVLEDALLGPAALSGGGQWGVTFWQVMIAALPSRQTPFRDTWWRGQGRLDLLGVSFASLKEQVDSEVGLAGSGRVALGCLHAGAFLMPPSGFAQRRQQLLQEAHQLSDTLRR